MIVIADIAGRYDELMLLLDKMPKDEDIVLCGDIHDRGKDSNKVIQWAIDNKVKCIKSNHGDLFIGYFNRNRGTNYPCFPGFTDSNFLVNGGNETLASYGGIENVSEEHVKWLAELPWYIETDDLIVTHGPIPATAKDISEAIGYDKGSDRNYRNTILWNRQNPVRRDKFQVYGHNTYAQTFEDAEGEYAVCIDNCGMDQLMAIHWPSKVVYVQDYL